MDKQFVTFEIAKKLKELGFDEISRFGQETSLYDKDGNFMFYSNYGFMYSGLNGGYIKAPLWQQVVEWLRTDKKIFVTVTCNPDIVAGLFNYSADVLNIDFSNGKDTQILDGFTIYENYPDALQEGIEEALTLFDE